MGKLVLFGSSFNPPTNGHFLIVKRLIELFNKVIVVPRGTGSNKLSTLLTTPLQRKEMVELTFSGILPVEIDFYDLDKNTFTPTWTIDQRYKTRSPDSEIWHAVGGDIVEGGKDGNSEIQRKWRKGKEIWANLNWAVISHPDCLVSPSDLPPHSMLVRMKSFRERSTTARERIASNQPVSDLVPPAVESYITTKNLYKT